MVEGVDRSNRIFHSRHSRYSRADNKVGVTDGSLLRPLRVGYSTFRMVMTVIGLSLEFVRLYAIQMPALS